VVGALDAIFDDFKAQASPAFGVGFTIFADREDKTITDTSAGPYSKMDVPIAFVDPAQHNRLRARVDLTEPYLGTPTFEVLSGQYPLLEAYNAAPPLLPDGKKVLVFMSDGIPDPDMPAGQNEGPWSLALAQTQHAKGILTFSVGIGSIPPPTTGDIVYDPKFMGALAVAGGTANPGCNPNEEASAGKMCHFQITPGGKPVAQLKQEFIDALNKIRTSVLTCEFKLTRTQGDIDPARVNVIYTNGTNGQQTLVPKGQNGWVYDDPNNPTKVILTGSVCDTVKADPRGKVEVVVGCKTVIK
jgi:hypothetical protein